MILFSLLSLGCPKPVDVEPPVTTVEAVQGTETPDAWVQTPEVLAPTVSPEEQRRAEVNQAAVLLTNRANGAQAATLLEEVVKADRGNVYAWFNLGLAYEYQGDTLRAQKAYQSALVADPGYGPAYVNLAAMELRAGSAKKAEARYREGIAKVPDEMELWAGLIASLRAQGRLADAEREAKRALQIDSNAKSVYAVLGFVYIDKGQLDLANFIVQKALRIKDGDDSQLYLVLGRVYQKQDKAASARDNYLKALELDPNLVAARIWLSDYYLNNRNFGDTVPLLEKARELDPEEPAIYYNLGIAYRGVGRYEESAKAYQTALRLEPGPAPHLNLGILYGDYLKQYDLAVREYETFKQMGGDAAIADRYIEKTLKEQEKVRRLEERRKRMEANKAKANAKAAESATPPPAPAPVEAPAPEGVPAELAPAEPTPEEAPPASEGSEDSPWGGSQ